MPLGCVFVLNPEVDILNGLHAPPQSAFFCLLIAEEMSVKALGRLFQGLTFL